MINIQHGGKLHVTVDGIHPMNQSNEIWAEKV